MDVYTRYPSPIGELFLTANETGLTGLWLDSQSRPEAVEQQEHPVFLPVKNWLDAYFRGEKPPIPQLSLSPAGTAFQRQVWDILRRIPYGQTVTYGQIAEEMAQILGRTAMSAQAVGQAVGKNPISIIIPCHRCVGAGGKLTGYAGGLDKKIWLLRHEGWYQEDIT